MPPILAARIAEFIGWAAPGPRCNFVDLLVPDRRADGVFLRAVAARREFRR